MPRLDPHRLSAALETFLGLDGTAAYLLADSVIFNGVSALQIHAWGAAARALEAEGYLEREAEVWPVRGPSDSERGVERWKLTDLGRWRAEQSARAGGLL